MVEYFPFRIRPPHQVKNHLSILIFHTSSCCADLNAVWNVWISAVLPSQRKLAMHSVVCNNGRKVFRSGRVWLRWHWVDFQKTAFHCLHAAAGEVVVVFEHLAAHIPACFSTFPVRKMITSRWLSLKIPRNLSFTSVSVSSVQQFFLQFVTKKIFWSLWFELASFYNFSWFCSRSNFPDNLLWKPRWRGQFVGRFRFLTTTGHLFYVFCSQTVPSTKSQFDSRLSFFAIRLLSGDP